MSGIQDIRDWAASGGHVNHDQGMELLARIDELEAELVNARTVSEAASVALLDCAAVLAPSIPRSSIVLLLETVGLALSTEAPR